MAIRFLTSQNIQAGTLTVSTIANLATASNVFLVSDAGLVKYRTAAQVRSDIGAGTGSGSVTSVSTTNGAGISASVTNATTTPNITITNTDLGSSQAIFKNIVVSGQSTIVANSNNDTLNFANGSNITITTNAATDTITIASTDTNNFPSSLAWDTGTGILTLGRTGLSSLTVDLDGRYPENNGNGASGTWGINITGTASSTQRLDDLANYTWSSSALPASFPEGMQLSFVGPAVGEGSWQNYGSIINARTYSGGGGSLQMYVPYGPSNGGDALQVRFGNYNVSSGNSWTSWKTVLQSDNFNLYAPTLTGTGASGNWGISITGNAATASALTSMNISQFTNDSGYTTALAVSSNYTPMSRTLTINGVTQDLSANRSWTISAGTGTVTSVAALTLGTAGTDLSSTVANGTTTPVITLNVPDASATARGVITTGTQTIAGSKTFSAQLTAASFSYTTGSIFPYAGSTVYYAPTAGSHLFGGGPGNVQNNVQIPNGTLNIGLQTASTIASFDSSKNVVSLPTATYPSLAELAYVKGVTSAIQTQLNSKGSGTVTSVSGTGSYGGLSLSGTVTGSGNLTFGGTPTGTWPISITGSADTSTISLYVSSPDGDRIASNKLPNGNPSRAVQYDFAASSSITGATGNYAGVMTYRPWDGTSASTGDSSYQLAFANQSGVNASGPAQLLLRNGINSTWNSWQTMLSSSNYNSYSPTLTGTGASGTWGISISGNAGTATTATNLSGGSVSASSIYGPFISINGNGSSGDPYGTIAVTEPANASNYSYYGLTRAGNIGAGFGITGTTGALTLGANAFWFGLATSGTSGVMAGAWVAFNASSFITAGSITANGVLLTGNTGTVTSVATGTGLTGGTITTSGTISLANTAVTAGSYTSANITVDAQGRITAASNGSGGGGISGSGTVNYIPKWNGASSLTNSAIFDNGTNVLIGTTDVGTPTFGSAPQFVIAAAAGGVIDIRSLNTNILANSLLGRIQFTGKDDVSVGYTTAAIEAIAASSANTGNGGGGILKFSTSSIGTGQSPQPRMWINNNGLVTIASTSLGYTNLTVQGSIYSSGGIVYAASGDGCAIGNSSILSSVDVGLWSLNGDEIIAIYDSSTGIYYYGNTYLRVQGAMVGVGGINPSYPLHVSGNVSNISIYATNDIVAFSDQSVKENIRPIENVIERIQKSRGVLYDRTDSNHKDNIGFIAQELEVAFPELVVTNEDGTKAVKYQNAVAVLFEAIKDQQKQIDELKELMHKLIK